MRATLAPTSLDVNPGESVDVPITVTNDSDIIDGFRLEIDGLDPSWIHQQQPVITLFPGERGVISFTVRVPKNGRKGSYPVEVDVTSTVDSRTSRHVDLWLSVRPLRAVAIKAIPSVVTKGSSASVVAEITNSGNVSTTFDLSAVDATGLVNCTVEPRTIEVPPDWTMRSTVTMRGPRPWLGTTATRLVTVTARAAPSDEPGALPSAEVPVTFHQRPRIARGMMTFLILAAIVGLWTLVFSLFIGLNKQAPAGKAGPDTNVSDDVKNTSNELFTGELNVPTSLIAASLTGTVVSTTDGKPVPRVAVVAVRLRPNGKEVSAAAAATLDDGTYTVGGLLPGRYRLAVSADGFVTSNVPVPAKLSPLDKVSVEPIALEGDPGRIAGDVIIPNESKDLEFTVAYSQIIDDAEVTPLAAAERVALKDGAFSLDNLATPGTYRLGVAATQPDTYARLVFEVTLKGGEERRLNPLRLTTEPGTLSGEVTDGVQLLGGVKVVITGAGFKKEVLTPTQGAVGSFSMVGLPTPGDYVLTFSKDGYLSKSQALSLAAGQSNTTVNEQLSGGFGQVSGTVKNAALAGLGGVEVTIEGNGFSGSSTTLTVADPTDPTRGIGSYTISSIPVGGAYTLTYRLAGYEAATIQVELVAGATKLSGIDVALRPLVGRVNGTVQLTGDNSPSQLARIEVRLSDATTERKTKLTTSPAGSFTFPDVLPGSYTVAFYVLADGADIKEDRLLGVVLRIVTIGASVDASTTLTVPQ